MAALQRVVGVVLCLAAVVAGCAGRPAHPGGDAGAGAASGAGAGAGPSGTHGPVGGRDPGPGPAQVPRPAPGAEPPAQAPVPASPCQAPRPGQPYGEVWWRDGGWARYHGTGTCRVRVAPGEVRVVFYLPAGVEEAAARAALKLPPGLDPEVRFTRQAEGAALEVRLTPWPGRQSQAAGGAQAVERGGRELAVGLAGPLGPGGTQVEITFVLEREEAPRLQVEWRLPGGAWQPAPAGSTLPRQALELRLTGPDLPAVAVAVQQAVRAAGGQATGPHAGDGALLVSLPAPPPRLWVEFPPASGFAGWGYALYFGTPPVLVALAPATGQEQAVAEMPPEVYTASLSPGGTWALLVAVAPDHLWREQVWVVNTATGQRWLTGFGYPLWPVPIAWLEDRVVVPAVHTVQTWHLAAARGQVVESAALRYQVLSPDSRYLAGFALDWVHQDEPLQLVPAAVVVYDLAARVERVFPGLVRFAARGSGAPPALPMAWAPNGGLLVQDVTGRDPPLPTGRPLTRVLRLDPATGAADAVGAQLTGRPLTRVLRLDPATGAADAVGAQLPAPARPSAGQAGAWQEGPGGWQVRAGGGWGPVVVRGPGGADRELGQGLVLGWRHDGRLLVIRWDNPAPRRQRAGL